MRRLAWLAVVLLVASACRENGTFVAAGETNPPTTPPPFPGCVQFSSMGDTLCASPIKAAFDDGARTTVYTAHLSLSMHISTYGQSIEPITYQWSGPNCGEWVPQEQRTRSDPQFDTIFTWSHPHPPCGNTQDHSDVTVKLTASGGRATITCTYVGSLSGSGPICSGYYY